MHTGPTIPATTVPCGATHAELRRQHIERFRALPPEERLAWSLQTGWAIRDSLSPKKAKLQESLRHGG